MTDTTTPPAGLIEGEPELARVTQAARVNVVRDIDVPKGAWPWIEGIALECEPPNRRIEHPCPDAETIVLWHNERPAAFVLNQRDQFNRSVQFRVDLRLAAQEAASAPADAKDAMILRLEAALEWALDNGDREHPHYPERVLPRTAYAVWQFPYLMSGTPFGGGVGTATFPTALEAVEAARTETRS